MMKTTVQMRNVFVILVVVSQSLLLVDGRGRCAGGWLIPRLVTANV
jgi:hypothetical protein